jgi:hypothetical protein
VMGLQQALRRGAVSFALATMALPLGCLAQQLEQQAPVAADTARLPSQESSAGSSNADTVPGSAPEVIYQEGQLSIGSKGSSLADVLKVVAQKTGAAIDVPAGSGLERVVERVGPGAADAVLTRLLTGSDFNFVILSLPHSPHIPARVLLFPRGAPGEAQAEAEAAPASSGDQEPQLYGAGFAVTSDDSSAEAAAAPAQQNEPPDAIPGPVLNQMQKDFLRQHELQRQQQQQQQGGAPPSN